MTPPSPHLKKWLVPIGLLILLPMFFFGGSSRYSPRSVCAVWDLGHIIFFFLFVCVAASQDKGKFSLQRAIKILIVVVVFGAAIECIQSGIDGRTASNSDVARDLMGGILGVLWCGQRHFSLWQRRVAMAMSIVVCTWNLLPAANFALDEWQAQDEFPLLAGFESRRELSRWAGNSQRQQSNIQVRQGEYSLRTALTTDKYSGVNLEYFPKNWHNFTALQLSIFNAEADELTITIRIHDQDHEKGPQRYKDRFNRSFTLQPGWNDLKISLTDVKNAPQKRVMDMANIRGLGIFVIDQPKKRIIFIDNVRLTE